jgi:hypothetical protein
MKLAAIALDYDGTIAVSNTLDPSVRSAISEARSAGIAVLLVTGRRLDDLKRVAGDLACFDVVVAENGAVVDFPLSGRHVVLGHPPQPAFVDAVRRRGVVCDVGESLVEADARDCATIIDVIHTLEQPLVLTFNRGRVMVSRWDRRCLPGRAARGARSRARGLRQHGGATDLAAEIDQAIRARYERIPSNLTVTAQPA